MAESESLQYNEADEIDGPDDVELPKFAHHLKIRSELDRMLQMDLLTVEETNRLYEEWREDRQ